MITLKHLKMNEHRTKYFFEHNGQIMEFVIELDELTNDAYLWVKDDPDNAPAVWAFASALFAEWAIARGKADAELLKENNPGWEA